MTLSELIDDPKKSAFSSKSVGEPLVVYLYSKKIRQEATSNRWVDTQALPPEVSEGSQRETTKLCGTAELLHGYLH